MQWREEQPGDPFSNQEKIYKVMKMGYARLNVLRAEIKARINQDSSLCTDLTKEGSITRTSPYSYILSSTANATLFFDLIF